MAVYAKLIVVMLGANPNALFQGFANLQGIDEGVCLFRPCRVACIARITTFGLTECPDVSLLVYIFNKSIFEHQ